MANHDSADSGSGENLNPSVQVGREASIVTSQRPVTQRTQQSHSQVIPLEVILAIFTLVVSGNHAFVIILAQVCKSWRHVVVSTPILWSTLSLSDRKPEEKAIVWRSRNKGLLRGLHIRSGSQGVFAALGIFKDVALKSLRFLSVRYWGYGNLRSFLPQLTPSVISNVESLDLTATDYRWFLNTSELRLRSLVANRTFVDWATLGDHSTELRHLTYKELVADGAVPDILWLLHRNPKLESILLSCCGYTPVALLFPSPSSSPRHIPPSIMLHNLTKLSLSGPSIPVELLSRLPIIQALMNTGAASHLESIVTGYDWETEPVDLDLLIALLRDAIPLKYLELLGIANVTEVIEAITQNPRVLCPKLATLDLSQCLDVTDESLIALVEARNDTLKATSSVMADSPTSVAKLQTLAINDKVTDGGLTWLREHVPHVTCNQAKRQRKNVR
ncbi:hypothetical protein BC835DRAFT_1418190 [Cytidiella melzeri]|nr:hypothetical protein BC835DRAFT_1418190 [Cytidiella melzeri]